MVYILVMNVATLDLNLLRVFDAIGRTQNVTLAGEALDLTQPAMSNALGRLRRHFDDHLFVRTPSGMRPTPLGERLAGPVREALALIEATLATPVRFDPARSDRLFRISTSDLGETIFLPPMIEAIRRRAPGVRIETRPVPLAAIAAALESGEVDLAMGALAFPGRGVRAHALFREPYVCVLRADHPRVGRGIARRQLETLDYVLVAPSETAHKNVELTLNRLGLGARVAVRTPHFMALPGILERTDLVAVLPVRLAELFCRDGRLQAVPFPHPLAEIEIKAFWHERFERDPAIAWLRALTIELHGVGARANAQRASARARRKR